MKKSIKQINNHLKKVDGSITNQQKKNDNTYVLSEEINAFTNFMNKLGFGNENGLDLEKIKNGDLEITFSALDKAKCSYASFIIKNELNYLQRSILLLTLLPELRPGLLDYLFIFNKNIEKEMADTGGRRGKAFNGFIPTIETALFLFAGYNLKKRFEVLKEFYDDALLISKSIVMLEPDNKEPFASRKIEINKDVFAEITETELPSPHFSSDFPAKRLKSPLNWSENPNDDNDLILNPFSRKNLNEMIYWVKHHKYLKKMKLVQGYRCLFYGPPGTGKTLTATLIGKRWDIPVYRIDLSLMISKYIGETEKNLEKVFSMAENRDWILFFDEADALFGKRTEVSSSNDKFANQETSFLLQRVEEFPGLIILATNLKDNLDQAFIRRFQSIIHFPMPTAEERKRLWNNALKKVSTANPESQNLKDEDIFTFQFSDNIDMELISKKVEISGAAIDNVIRYCVLNALNRYFDKQTKDQTCTIERYDLLEGIKREMNKEGTII